MGKITKANPAKTVSAYLDELPENVRTLLEELRKTIKSAAPQAEEVISYQIPTYKYKGPLLHFAAQKDHCSLTVVSQSILKTFKKDLLTFKISGRTIHFSPEKPLPANLVRKIVHVRIEEARLDGKENKKPVTKKSGSPNANIK